MKKFLPKLRLFTILSIFLLAASIVKAQTRTASVSGNWNNIATWGGASVPSSGNDVVINNGVTVTVNVVAACNSITIGATNATGGVTIAGTNSLTVTNGVSIGDLTDNSSGITIAVGAGTFSCASLTMADPTGSNDDIALTVSTGTATVTGNLTMNCATTQNRVDITGAGTLNVGGLSSTNGSFNPSATSTVNYGGTTQTIRAATYNNLILSGSGAKTISGVTVNGTLSIQGTATTTGTSATFGAASTLEYAGSAAQTTTGVEFPAASGPRTLKINNSNGVTLHAARTITTSLVLANGVLTTTAGNILNIANNGTTSGASDYSFVDGPLSKTGNDVFTFPVGVPGQGLRTIGISAPASPTSVFTAQFIKSDPHGLSNTMGAGLVNISACEYWTLANTGTASNASVTLSWSANSCNGASYVGNTNTLRVGRLSAGTWVNEGRLSTTGSLSAGTIISAAAVTTFGTSFVLATSAVDNALPVMFADVKAYQKNNGVQVDWSNLTERDLISYIVERSVNGVNYSAINQQSPKANNNDKESYSAFDATPSSGSNFYRIKVLEISGKVIYSRVIRVDIDKTQGFTIYPNPVRGNQVSVSINNRQGQYTIKVLNTSGQVLYSERIVHQGGSLTQIVELPAAIKPGVYNMLISGDDYRDAKMFIVQ